MILSASSNTLTTSGEYTPLFPLYQIITHIYQVALRGRWCLAPRHQNGTEGSGASDGRPPHVATSIWVSPGQPGRQMVSGKGKE